MNWFSRSRVMVTSLIVMVGFVATLTGCTSGAAPTAGDATSFVELAEEQLEGLAGVDDVRVSQYPRDPDADPAELDGLDATLWSVETRRRPRPRQLRTQSPRRRPSSTSQKTRRSAVSGPPGSKLAGRRHSLRMTSRHVARSVSRSSPSAVSLSQTSSAEPFGSPHHRASTRCRRFEVAPR